MLSTTFMDMGIALGLGLLVGLQKERAESPLAGLRTFALVTWAGAMAALVGEATTQWIIVGGLLAVVALMVTGNVVLMQSDPESDPGQTTESAVVLMYLIGALVVVGPKEVAIVGGAATAILLHLREELHTWVDRLSDRDVRAMMQFVLISLVILPVLPDQAFGPYAVVNPRQVWWMVVLISGVSLAGYAALQLVGAKHGAAFVGIFGGLASSTATTMVYARNARASEGLSSMAALVIVLANLVMVVRVTVLAAVVAPGVLPALFHVVVPALSFGGIALMMSWRQLSNGGHAVLPETSNPTELRTALGFGALYAVVLFCAAWLSDYAGTRGLYVLAIVTGFTDIDAIALSSLRLFALDKLALEPAAIAIGLGMIANLSFKAGMAAVIGGQSLGRKVFAGMGSVALGLALGIGWHALGL